MFLADGGLSGATAALSAPYRHSGSRGVLRFEDPELLGLCRTVHDAGYRIAIHAIGDVAIDQVLRVYEALGRGPLRHRIEHLGLPTEEHLRRAARLDLIVAPQSVFLHELGRNFRACLPDESNWGTSRGTGGSCALRARMNSHICNTPPAARAFRAAS